MKNERALQEKVALITGATRGIGRAVALGLAEMGVHPVLVGRNEKALLEVANEVMALGVPAHTIVADLTDMDLVAKVPKEAVDYFSKIDFLVNNAGQAVHAPVQDADLSKWDQVLDTNLRSVIHLTHAALPALMNSPRGAVVNIASVASKITYGGGGIYATSKHGVLAFGNCLFDDIREKGIKVCNICPGLVNTDMASDPNKFDGDKMIQAKDISDAVVYALMTSKTVCPTEIVLRPQRSPYL